MLSGATAFQGISMAKRPAERFQTIAEVRAALEKALAKPADTQPSIAVLPFANMSRDADDEYFSDGLAEEIINLLVHVPGLKVTARTSAFAFRGVEQDITKIAAALKVRTILEGSVRRAGNRIRVTAQLINAEDGYHIWSERYDRELTDIFAMQDEIAAAIAAVLQLKLSIAAPARRMPNMAAYEAYLKYRAYQWRFTPEESRKSKECLEQALALDPQFALPYVGLADFHLALFMFGAISFQESMPRARQLAQRALELDPDLTEAHGMLGIVAAMEFDWPEATRRFRTVMAREPVTPHVRAWYACFYLSSVGRAREAKEQMESVVRDDPYCQMWHFMSCISLLCLGLEEAAIAAIRKASELDPQLWVASMALGVVHASRGRYAEARACAEKAFSAAPWSPYCIGLMAAVLRNAGESEKAAELLGKLRDDAYGGPAGLTCYHFSCGEIDSAVEWAGKAVEQRFSGILSTLIRPYESRFSQSAGWPALLARMNLPLT